MNKTRRRKQRARRKPEPHGRFRWSDNDTVERIMPTDEEVRTISISPGRCDIHDMATNADGTCACCLADASYAAWNGPADLP